MNETQLVSKVETHLRTNGYSTYREVPFLQRVLDLVGVHLATGEILIVEGKLLAWRRAIRQARTSLLVGDRVFIAIPESMAGRIDIRLLDDLGIGVIAVNERVEVMLPSRPSKLAHPAHRKWLLAAIGTLSGAAQIER